MGERGVACRVLARLPGGGGFDGEQVLVGPVAFVVETIRNPARDRLAVSLPVGLEDAMPEQAIAGQPVKKSTKRGKWRRVWG